MAVEIWENPRQESGVLLREFMAFFGGEGGWGTQNGLNTSYERVFGSFSALWLRAVRNLGRVEELGGDGLGDCIDQDSVGHASNEVANVVWSCEWRHGAAVGFVCLLLGFVGSFPFIQGGVIGSQPCIGAADDGRVGFDGVVFVVRSDVG